jgi:ATP-dependent Zn protease
VTPGRVLLSLALILALAVGLSAMAYTFLAGSTQGPSVGWGQLLQNISKGQVARIVQSGTTLTVTDAAGATYTVIGPGQPEVNSDYRLDFERAAADGGRTFDDSTYVIEPAPDNSWIGLVLTGILPLIVIGGFIYFMMRMARRQIASGASLGARSAAPTLADRLKQLDDAREAGLITASEYDAACAQILDRA